MNAPTAPATNDLLKKAELQAKVLQALKPLLPSHALLYQSEDTTPYECDGLTAYRARPLLVALPETEAQVAAVAGGKKELQQAARQVRETRAVARTEPETAEGVIARLKQTISELMTENAALKAQLAER